jgi:WD40 repeat protein
VWDVAKRKELRKFEDEVQPSGVTCVAFSAESARVLSGGKDGSVRLWLTGPYGK